MSKMIQLRNVSDQPHRKLKRRAKFAGMSLSDYFIAEIQRAAQRPSLNELLRRLSRRSRVAPRISRADAVRAERDLRRHI